MKKLLLAMMIALGLTISGAPFAVGSTYAVDVFEPCTSNATGSGTASGSAACKDAKAQGNSSTNPIITALKSVISILSYIIGAFAIIIIIVSGLRMTLSSGDAQAAAKARSAIIYAVVGIIVAALAQTLVIFVLNKI